MWCFEALKKLQRQKWHDINNIVYSSEQRHCCFYALETLSDFILFSQLLMIIAFYIFS